VTLPHAELLKAGGEPIREAVDVPVGHRRIDAATADSTTKYGCGGVWVRFGCLFEEGVKWPPGRGQAPGDPTVICRFRLACRLHHAHNVETSLTASPAHEMPGVLLVGDPVTTSVEGDTEFAALE